MKRINNILPVLFITGLCLGIMNCDSSGSSDNSNSNLPGEETVEQASREDMVNGFISVIRDDPEYAENNETFTANLNSLVDYILSAAGEKGIYKLETNIKRIVKYVIFTYGLTDFRSYISDDFSSRITDVSIDQTISKIGRTTASYSVVVPLDNDEIPGDNNSARIAYYYNSDVSFNSVAESLIGIVRDDTINDEIILYAVKIKAEYGLFEDAELLIESQIFGSVAKGDGYRLLGWWLNVYGNREKALSFLEKAEKCYKSLIEASGTGNFSSSDTSNLQSLANAYREAGAVDKAVKVLEYLSDLAIANSSTTTYGRLIIGTWWVVDEYLDAGDSASALPLIDSMYQFSSTCPANESNGQSFFKAKIYYLIETAERYASAGNNNKVLEIYQLIENIRANDGIVRQEPYNSINWTKANTWTYMDDLVEVLYKAGFYNEALEVAQSIPASYKYYKWNNNESVWVIATKDSTSYQGDAYIAFASVNAIENGIGELSSTEPATLAKMSTYDIIEYLIVDERDKVEALTYLGSNSSVHYIAAALIEKGGAENITEAKKALALAASILAATGETGEDDIALYVIDRGHCKIAELYYKIDQSTTGGDNEALLQARQHLSAAETILAGLTAAQPKINGNIAIAKRYFLFGDRPNARSYLAAALTAADTFTAANPDSSIDSAELYRSIILAYLEHDEKDIAAVIDKYVAVASAIYSDGGSEDAKEDEVKHLVNAANYYSRINLKEKALTVLASAQNVAVLVANNEDRVDLFTDDVGIIKAYANADGFDEALEATNSISTIPERNEGLKIIAETYCTIDAFPNTDVASVDTDKDGKPDFFHPLVPQEDIAASGLVLDDDSDGDGIPDSKDIRPLFAD